MRRLIVLAALLAGCGVPPESGSDSELEFDPSSSLERAADAIACDPPPTPFVDVCSGGGLVYTASLRVGALAGTRGEIAQTFVANRTGLPGRIRLKLRRLRPTTPLQPALTVDIRKLGTDGAIPTNPAEAIAVATLASPLAGANPEVELLFRAPAGKDSEALVGGTKYAFVVSVGASGNDAVSVGVALHQLLDIYPHGEAFSRGVRPSAERPFRALAGYDVSFSLSIGDGFFCTGGVCTLDTCRNAALDGDETGLDCGGSCAPCADGQACQGAADCESNYCFPGTNVCATPDCFDGVQNGAETGVDCGGGICAGCDTGAACGADGDCASLHCAGDVCQAPTCDDQRWNGSEADTDCGAACGVDCVDGAHCFADADCASGSCSAQGVCLAPSCSDGRANGSEGGVDCGGSCPARCGQGSTCNVESDCGPLLTCASGICSNLPCQTDAFNGSALGSHWSGRVGSNLDGYYTVSGGALRFPDAPFASTPSQPTHSWIYDPAVDLGNQLYWPHAIGTGEFDVTSTMFLSSSVGELVYAGLALTTTTGQIEAFAGLTDGSSAGTGALSVWIRGGTGWSGTSVSAATPVVRFVRANGKLTAYVNGTAVFSDQPFGLNIARVSLVAVPHRAGSSTYPFGQFDVHDVSVCY